MKSIYHGRILPFLAHSYRLPRYIGLGVRLSLAKAMLRLGEYPGGKFADEVIVISRVIESIIERRCHRKSHLIYNGVVLPAPPSTSFTVMPGCLSCHPGTKTCPLPCWRR